MVSGLLAHNSLVLLGFSMGASDALLGHPLVLLGWAHQMTMRS